MRPWTILCDFDGTITLADATDALLERHAEPQWRALEGRWLAGQIGSRECMSGIDDDNHKAIGNMQPHMRMRCGDVSEETSAATLRTGRCQEWKA